MKATCLIPNCQLGGCLSQEVYELILQTEYGSVVHSMIEVISRVAVLQVATEIPILNAQRDSGTCREWYP